MTKPLPCWPAMTSTLLLDGKIALVTARGASSGIGEAIAKAYARAGATVILTARRADKLQRVADEIEPKRAARRRFWLATSPTKKAFWRFTRKSTASFTVLDILAANAGQLADGLLGRFRPKNLYDMLAVNNVGVLNHLQAATRLMRRGQGGSIVITSSIIGRAGNEGQAAYAASRPQHRP